jgi:hypothetical protein
MLRRLKGAVQGIDLGACPGERDHLD